VIRKHRKKSSKCSFLYTNELNHQHAGGWFNTVLPYQRIVYRIFSISSAELESGERLDMQVQILFRYLEGSLERADAAGTHDLCIDSRVAMEKVKHLPLVTDNHNNISTDHYRTLSNAAEKIDKIFTLCLALNEKAVHIRSSEILCSILQLEADFIAGAMSILEQKEPSSVNIAGCRNYLLKFDTGIEKISELQVNPGEIYGHGKILTLLSELKRTNTELLASLIEVTEFTKKKKPINQQRME